MRKFTIWLTCLLFLASMGIANAQTKVITGTVTSSDDGLPIPGVTVMIPGTTVGTTTDIDGFYSLSVSGEATTLTFSFIGMEKQTFTLTGQTRIDVTMTTSSQLLDEVVVVGYGTTTKQSFVGSVKTVKSAVIQINQPQTFRNLLLVR